MGTVEDVIARALTKRSHNIGSPVIWWFPDWIKPFMGKRYFGLWFDFEQPLPPLPEGEK